MGVVSQESILFNDNVFRNIAFGDDHFDKEKVIDAAKMANAHEFIISLENGYETNIGCLLYTSPSPRDDVISRMPSSA